MRIPVCLLLFGVFSGCCTLAPADFAEFRRTDLYFGRDIPDPPDAAVDRRVDDAAWNAFVDEQIVPHFAGVTVHAAEGRWFDGETVIREDSVVVTLMYPAQEEGYYLDLIRGIARTYVERFEQQAVLIEHRRTGVTFIEGR